MERKISSSFTEFYKVYGTMSFFVLIAIIGFSFFNPYSSSFSLPTLLLGIVNLLFAFHFWRMKEVEMTDAGLLVSKRIFFNQKTIFVPYEKIEVVKIKIWWLGNDKRISIKFAENTGFGKEISFLSNGLTPAAQVKVVEELNQAVFQSQRTKQSNSAFYQFGN